MTLLLAGDPAAPALDIHPAERPAPGPAETLAFRESVAPASIGRGVRLPPPVRFVDQARRTRTCEDARRARAIVIVAVGAKRGALKLAIDEDIEAELASRGAMPPNVSEDAPYPTIVRDQIARAAAIPVRGICFAVPCLGRLRGDAPTLDDSDASALMAWIDAARDTDVRLRLVVLLDERDREVAIRAPRRLDDAIGVPEVAANPAPQQVAPTLVSTPEPEAMPSCANAEPRGEEDRAIAPPPPRLPSELTDLVDVKVAECKGDEGDEGNDEAADLEQAQRDAARREEERAARLVSAATWRAHALELDASRGPKPVRVVEKLFAQRYVPLLGALARDEVDGAVRDLVSEWRTGFAESYETAYPSLRVTGKRPAMVMDVPELAAKIGRLASARSVKLVLVDSMSFDLGERVSERMHASLGRRAVLVERNTLWSALPTVTPMQMHLLARGAEGFKDAGPPPSESDVARGRNVTALRRERLGNRELSKLDVVEARMRCSGASYDERLDAVADEVSDILVKAADSLPPRTLMYVFGDHGFVLGPGINGWSTGAATQGGASPEEVLVSGHAWLVDAVQ